MAGGRGSSRWNLFRGAGGAAWGAGSAAGEKRLVRTGRNKNLQHNGHG